MDRISIYKKVLLVCLPVLFLVGGVAAYYQQQTGCVSKEAKTKCKNLLKPYKYDSSNTTKITYKDKTQRKEIEVPLFLTEKYRIIFSTGGMPVKPLIKIFNKEYDAKNRELLYSSENTGADNEFTYETKKWTRKIFVDIEVPAVKDSLKTGCVFFILGYE